MARDVYLVADAEDPSKAWVKSFTDDTPADLPDLYRSDNYRWRIHSLKRNPVPQVGRPFVYGARAVTLKFGAGVIDATPTAGTFTITDPAGSQTTAAIAYNASAATVQTAIRAALTTNFSAAVVTSTGTGVYEIDRGATGAFATDITGNSDGLVPSGSTVNISNIQDGTSLLNEKWQLRLRKALPFLCSSGWSAFDAATVTVSIVQSGSATANKTYSVSWNTDAYAGSVTLSVLAGGTTGSVGPIPYNATGEEVAAAFAEHSGIASTDNVSVEQVSPCAFNIAFVGTLKNTNVPTISTSSNTLQVPVGDQNDIAVSTAGTDAILNGEESASIVYEIERRDESGKPQTYLFSGATIYADLITNTAGQQTGGENFLERSDAEIYFSTVTDYLGGGSTKLDGQSITGISAGQCAFFVHPTTGKHSFILRSGSETDNSPAIIVVDSNTSFYWESIA